MGRTQLQDAVPMTLGQEFDGLRDRRSARTSPRCGEAAALFREVNLGATAIGTGINADPRYADAGRSRSSRALTGEPIVAGGEPGRGDLGHGRLRAALRRAEARRGQASKICNDLRLLSSGPRAGFGEIRLPAVQPGSSIMPGKVNPVIPEVVNQVGFLVIGHDLTVTMAPRPASCSSTPSSRRSAIAC